ncbi:hypothetical protein DPMN_087660 [Dreissena polymorpha]|uniref:Uncharacterized protein n=1 Tax=Dreissena polymorpha TaxID=45954 RepID=A0A9D4KT60_DREPO|nr:hypothetical protein DPMN_087660 [Dreissena polymorpha]
MCAVIESERKPFCLTSCANLLGKLPESQDIEPFSSITVVEKNYCLFSTSCYLVNVWFFFIKFLNDLSELGTGSESFSTASLLIPYIIEVASQPVYACMNGSMLHNSGPRTFFLISPTFFV